MTRKFDTEQEEFWAGKFGEEYISRNTLEELLASNLWFFSKALSRVDNLSSVIEFGTNIGNNLYALHQLFPNIESTGIEINKKAIEVLKVNLPKTNMINDSILNFVPKEKFDLALIKGVLIHQDPTVLDGLYETIYNSSKKYILLAEYYNPSPVSLEYRGEKDKLFKRDFAGEIMNKYEDLVLIDFGFAYRRDKKSPQDDISWFLLAK
tara:strand:- start:14306 stop:14929 length:624 start_codon:yes stop_codon:yes gene_type:complete